MAIDFEQEYGVNAGYVEALFEEWKSDPSRVAESWRTLFENGSAATADEATADAADGAEDEAEGEASPGAQGGRAAPAKERAAPRKGDSAPRKGEAAARKGDAASSKGDSASGKADGAPRKGDAAPADRASAKAAGATKPAAAKAEPSAEDDEAELEPLRGIAGRIVANMKASLEVPTATSVRTISAKILGENRQVINEHMLVRAFGKASYTHLIAFALARALGENLRAQSSYVERDGVGHRRVASHVNLGLAIDVPTSGGRMLVVPNIKAAETLSFREFYDAYEDVVRRGREGKLGPADYAGTTCTLTNPGGFGTVMSVPRLMEAHGVIIATGSIGVPPELGGMSHAGLADLAIGPVMTMTSTYDHRVIQGAESGLLLKRIDELLQGEDGFYDEVFEALRVPWSPARSGADMRPTGHEDQGERQIQVWKLINAYRSRGGQLADLDPLGYEIEWLDSLDPSYYGLTVWDLDRPFLCAEMNGRTEMTLREILGTLRKAYCRRWTTEYMHITDRERKLFIRARVEDDEHFEEFSQEERIKILARLCRAENFERFLHNTYVGNKRFSLEGADTMIPALCEIIERSSERGVEKVVIGMAHRGRLNVLANVLGKSYEDIFQEFEGKLLPLSTEGSGDVKYHLGQRGIYKTRAGAEVEVILSANPSHLEAVDPVVCGMTRAYQDALGDGERRRVLAVLIHGDAAFSGQGVVAETLQMSELRAYTNGGTIHFIVNNQIGFTAGPRDLRSTYYCSDMAKSIEAPIMHANGDFPESVLRACRLAVDYQRSFGADAVVDMVCYRRWGHNEGDEPAYTQPALYRRIAEHPTTRASYRDLLARRGNLTAEEAQEISERADEELRAAQARFKEAPVVELPFEEIVDVTLDDAQDYVAEPSPETGVPAEKLVELVDDLNRVPESIVVHPNLLRQLRRRERMVRGEADLDWGCAEALAFGSLLRERIPIRLTGQDSGRGTFSHRHAVIRDQRTETEHVPLRALTGGQVRFEAWDSLLSEEAVVAFEYGYSVALPSSLVLWEAQFGDFANGAQIPIDQFITSGEAKWRQVGGLVMLLPHGYDGQGPEHSSARVERFLAACAGGNMSVVNCSTSAQYFHLLRRQGKAPEKRPLIVMTPKALLRDKRAASPIDDFSTGRFREVISDSTVAPERARRVLLATGKVCHDLESWREEHGVDDVAVVRCEQLYPFPKADLTAELERYGEDVEVVWVQEEPRNMGAWSFVLQRFLDLGRGIRYVGRAEAASPATGSYRRHQAEQEHLLSQAFA